MDQSPQTGIPKPPITDSHPSATEVDVLIIGGGPGGSTVSTLLANRGHRVAMLEREEHPRFHIGESLLPMNLPILETLGVLEEVEAIGVKKAGADFTADETTGEYQTFLFSRALGDSPAHAYEVRRSEFDQLLFENSQRCGVDARIGHRITGVEFDAAGGHHQAVSRDNDGHEIHWRARFVVDASGRHSFLAKKHGWHVKSQQHASAAIFGHFRNVPRRPDTNAGNISIYWFEHGWIWMIPLRDDVMSVGAVCYPDYLKQRDCSPETFLRKTVDRSPGAKQRMANALIANEVRCTGNYSYRSTRMTGEGFALVGDAYAFVDPVFSSGVYLSMNSAMRAVPVVEAWLSGDRQAYARSCRHYEKVIRRGIRQFSWFIHRFTTPAMRDLFRNPRNDWQVEQAVISMLAGDIFANAIIQRRLLIFRFIYHCCRLKLLRESFSTWRRKRRNIGIIIEDEHIMTP